jgi:hypothetical protein
MSPGLRLESSPVKGDEWSAITRVQRFLARQAIRGKRGQQ